MKDRYPKSGKEGSYSSHSTEKMKDGWGEGGPENTTVHYPKKLKGVNMSYEKIQVKEFTHGGGSKPGKDYAKKLVHFGTEESI